MEEIEKIKAQITPKEKKKFSTFLFFLLLSCLLWFLIKLSQNYSTQTEFTIHYTDIPTDKWMTNTKQPVKLSFVASGFKTLRFNMIRSQKRNVNISLDEISYRLDKGNIYQFASQYVAEKIADKIHIEPNDVKINEPTLYFAMDKLKSKTVPVRLQSKIDLQRQFNIYSAPVVSPSMVTIYGPEEIIDTILVLNTKPMIVENVNQDISTDIKLDLLEGQIQSDTKSIHVEVDIEKFTEASALVPIEPIPDYNLRYFPDKVEVKYLVPIIDFAKVTADSFKFSVDVDQINNLQPLLNLKLDQKPSNVQIIKIQPEQIEYIILQ